MRKLTLQLTALLVLTALLTAATQASAMISTTVEAKLATSGEITIHGNSTIDGLEARMVRGAIDSPMNNTAFFYTIETGNGVGYVNGTEAKAYADNLDHLAKKKLGTVFGGQNEVGLTIEELRAAWTGGRTLLTDEHTGAAFQAFLGGSAGGSPTLAPLNAVLDRTWAARPRNLLSPAGKICPAV
jgi:hypothetical protein